MTPGITKNQIFMLIKKSKYRDAITKQDIQIIKSFVATLPPRIKKLTAPIKELIYNLSKNILKNKSYLIRCVYSPTDLYNFLCNELNKYL